jgi:hypothetical protein
MRRFDVEGTAAAGRTVDGCIIPLLYTMTREHAAAAGFAFARERHELRGAVHPDRVEPADRSFPHLHAGHLTGRGAAGSIRFRKGPRRGLEEWW